MVASQTIDWDQIRERLRKSQTALSSMDAGHSAKKAATLRKRAERLANRSRHSTAHETMTVLTFQTGQEAYCLPIGDVTEIVRFYNCTPVPGSAAELVGVLASRGEICCVIDLAILLGLVESRSDSNGYVLFVKTQEAKIGFKVNQVNQVEHLATSFFETTDASSHLGQYTQATGSNGLNLLNLSQILTHSVFRT